RAPWTAQRAVGADLRPAHLHAATGMFVGTLRAQVGRRVTVAVGVGVDAQRQLARIGEALVQRQVFARNAHVVHAGQAVAGGGGERAFQRLGEPGVVRPWHLRPYQIHRLVDEHAGRLAVGAQDAAAIGLPVAGQRLSGVGLLDALHRRAVGPAGVA